MLFLLGPVVDGTAVADDHQQPNVPLQYSPKVGVRNL